MGSYGRDLLPTLAMQLAVGAEFSTLEQAGGGGLSRSFRRPKGQLSLAGKRKPGLDVNMTLQR